MRNFCTGFSWKVIFVRFNYAVHNLSMLQERKGTHTFQLSTIDHQQGGCIERIALWVHQKSFHRWENCYDAKDTYERFVYFATCFAILKWQKDVLLSTCASFRLSCIKKAVLCSWWDAASTRSVIWPFSKANITSSAICKRSAIVMVLKMNVMTTRQFLQWEKRKPH